MAPIALGKRRRYTRKRFRSVRDLNTGLFQRITNATAFAIVGSNAAAFVAIAMAEHYCTSILTFALTLGGHVPLLVMKFLSDDSTGHANLRRRLPRIHYRYL